MQFSTARLATRFHTTFTALKYQNYRTYLFGFFISNSGMLAQQTAAGYLIYDLTGSSTYLGYFGFAQGFAFIILALFSGVIADRVSRRKMLVFTQSGMLLQATVMTVLTFSGVIQAWHVIALTFIQGIIKALDSPNRLSFITNLVDQKDIINAIPLHSTTINSALILGPIVAGLLYNLFGPGWAFLFDALTYIPFIIMLLRMRTTHEKDHLQRKHTAAWAELKEGVHYAFSNHIIRLLLLSMVIYNIFGLSIRNLTPAWAADVLRGDAQDQQLAGRRHRVWSGDSDPDHRRFKLQEDAGNIALHRRLFLCPGVCCNGFIPIGMGLDIDVRHDGDGRIAGYQ